MSGRRGDGPQARKKRCGRPRIDEETGTARIGEWCLQAKAPLPVVPWRGRLIGGTAMPGQERPAGAIDGRVTPFRA